MDDILDGYTKAADTLRPRYDAIDPTLLYASVLAHFPKKPSRILDIGAGTGRDAAWLAGLGHDVLAVEPVVALRGDDRTVNWLDDRLPDLLKTRALGRKFDFILMNAVFQHVRPEERELAMQSLAGLMARTGRIVMTLRHGPGATTRPAFPFEAEDIKTLMANCGLTTVHKSTRAAVGAENKAAGVHWEYLVLGWAA